MGKVVIKIISADELDATTCAKIEKLFRNKHKDSEIETVYRIRPELLGGILIVDGDTYYDASIKGQLAKVKDLIINE